MCTATSDCIAEQLAAYELSVRATIAPRELVTRLMQDGSSKFACNMAILPQIESISDRYAAWAIVEVLDRHGSSEKAQVS